MRTHTMLRTAFRFGMIAAVAAGASFVAVEARAASSCDPQLDVNCSTGTGAFKYEGKQGLDTTIDTGFIPSSGPIQVRTVIRIDPVKGAPLYTVDMPRGAVLEATWPDKNTITLKAASGAQTDGTLHVQHTLTPDVELKLSLFGLNQTFDFPATSLINKIPGASFNYNSIGSKQFAPWGFAPVAATVGAPDLANARLFDLDFDQLPAIVDDNFGGNIAIEATTSPTFTYQTTKVTLAGGDTTLTANGGTANVPTVDADFMEVMTSVEGELTFAGTMEILPVVNLTRVLSQNISMSFPISVGLKKDYASVTPVQVRFQNQVVHIPLPNVKVPHTGADMGDVKTGSEGEKTISIDNTGELGAQLSFKSSDPQFVVPNGTLKVASKGKGDLKIVFRPNAAGPATATITVLSNDPDSPEQTLKITANGADVIADPAAPGDKAGPDGAPAPGADSGCGCKVGASSSPVPGFAGIGLLGLGLAVLARRRRSE